jgi:hypothetical protein
VKRIAVKFGLGLWEVEQRWAKFTRDFLYHVSFFPHYKVGSYYRAYRKAKTVS